MMRYVATALAAVLVCGAGLAGAASKPKTVTRLCVNVEQRTDFPSYGDLNLYRGDRRVCLVGKRGKAGARGKIGKTGEAGPAGADGLTGAQGVPGVQGRQGDKGEQGWQGVQGIPGEVGATGPRGPQGDPGAAGPTGPAGAQGEAGPQGPTGEAGPQGPPGRDGSGLGNGLAWLCVNDSGDSLKWGGTGDEPDCQGEAGHTLPIRIVILNEAA